MTEEPTQSDIEHALDVQQAKGGGALKVRHTPHRPKPRGNAQPGYVHPIIKMVRSIVPNGRTTKEVADELGVSRELVRRWAREGRCNAPSLKLPIGDHGKLMSVYTPEDVQRLKAWHANNRRLIRVEYPREPERKAS